MSARRAFLIATVFLAPAFLAVVVLRLWPALLAFERSLVAPRATSYSLDNYYYIFSDPDFLNSLAVTLKFLVIVNPLQVGLALLLAILVNAKMPAIGLWRALIALPIAIPPSVSATIWGIAYRPDGPLNATLSAFGLEPMRFLTSPDQAMLSIIVIVSWVGIGYWMTFILAGLQDIPRTLYEAVEIDGANPWQRFRYLTLPLLRRPLTFVLVANTVANFLVFAPVQILTGGGPQGSTDLIMNQIYSRAFVLGDVASAYAATSILVAMVLVVVMIQFRLMKTEGDEA
jgi:multiple sugar transport system permease protein